MCVLAVARCDGDRPMIGPRASSSSFSPVPTGRAVEYVGGFESLIILLHVAMYVCMYASSDHLFTYCTALHRHVMPSHPIPSHAPRRRSKPVICVSVSDLPTGNSSRSSCCVPAQGRWDKMRSRSPIAWCIGAGTFAIGARFGGAMCRKGGSSSMCGLWGLGQLALLKRPGTPPCAFTHTPDPHGPWHR